MTAPRGPVLRHPRSRLSTTWLWRTIAVAACFAAARPAAAQWTGVHEQFYWPASHNWAFRERFGGADRLFNAFDYGHAILYETLLTRPAAPPSLLESQIYDRLTKRVLVRPPRVPLEESAIEIEYAKLVPEAKAMFDWAHVLHRQVYDVWADERLAPAQKDAQIARMLRYYQSRPDLAFSSRPKSMELMEGQHYSLAFRQRFPKFNGLIWAYHWLQVGLYEPLVTGTTSNQRKTGVNATVARFWQMLEAAPDNMPRLMPMTVAVAPMFAERYPELAIIFDNLHGMHDVVSDILASDLVPRAQKRSAILHAAALYRDDASYLMTVQEWRAMALAMGVQNMGGPAVDVLLPQPQGTAERGATMDSTHARHVRPSAPDTAGGHRHDAPAAGPDPMVRMLLVMLQDDAARARIRADSVLHRLVLEMIERVPEREREPLRARLRGRDESARNDSR